METTTTTKPLTYGAAAKVATPVNTDELRDLIAQDNNPDIFRRKGTTRRIGWNLRIRMIAGLPHVGWDCDYGDGYDVASPCSYEPLAPIFNFERLGRIVRWEAK